MAAATDKFYIRSKDNNNTISFGKFSSAESKVFNTIFIKVVGSDPEDPPEETLLTSKYNVSLNSDMVIEVWSNNTSLDGMYISATKTIEIGGNIMSLIAGETNFASTNTFHTTSSANFKGLFKGNTHLVDASDLYIPSTLELKKACFESMFEGCTGLTDAPALTPTTLSIRCYSYMFSGCTHLVNPPTCSATQTARECFSFMFYGCSALTSVMIVNFEDFYTSTRTANTYGYEMASMYKSCTALTTGYERLNHGYTVGCYSEMFYGCTSLRIPSIFSDGFPSLVNLNDPHTLKSYCCEGMYQRSGVESVSIPTVPIEQNERTFGAGAFGEEEIITQVSSNLFENMYKECTGLTVVATVGLSGNTPLNFGNVIPPGAGYFYNGIDQYQSMFLSCTNITTVNISFGKLNTRSARLMFLGCTKITSIKLTIDSVYNWTNNDKKEYAVSCCESMFEGCTSLRTINAGDFTFPSVSSRVGENNTTILEGGVSGSFCTKMFKGCTRLSTVNMTIPFANNAESKNIWGSNACELMFEGCTDLSNVNNLSFSGYLGNNSLKSMFKGCTNLVNISSTEIELDFAGNSVCVSMFDGCTKLKNVSKLKINNLTSSCCESMFTNCTALETPPSNFFGSHKYPSKCYKNMFKGCTALKTIPFIYGDTLIHTEVDQSNNPIIPEFYEECFSHMFDGCINLASDFYGIYGKFQNGCCSYMFNDCRKLKSVRMIKPILSISGSDMKECFSYMFAGCIALNILPPGDQNNPAADAKNRVPVIDISEAGKHEGSMPSPEIGKILGALVFENMFLDCTALTEEPIIYTGEDETFLSLRTYGTKCFSYMYSGCNKMKATLHKFANRNNIDVETGQPITKNSSEYRVIRKIKGNNFGEKCFSYMYSGCAQLTTTLSIIGVGDNSVLGENACDSMYNACTILAEVPNINVKTIRKKALSYLCNNCQQLNTLLWTSGITADKVEERSLECAFKSCTTLPKMVPLYIKEYGPHACEEMFMLSGITDIGTSFATAEKVSEYSFYKMFENCTSLITLANAIIPGAYINYLPVTQAALRDPNNIESKPKYTYTINGTDYNYFYGVLSDGTTARYYIEDDIKINGETIQRPEKVTLYDYTFGRMFYGCSNLKTPVPKMNNIFYSYYSCYKMFANTKLLTLPELTPVKYNKYYEPGMKDDGWYVAVSGNSPASGSTIYATTPIGKYIYKQTNTPVIEDVPEGTFCAMFMNTKITTIPKLYAKKFGKNAGNSMFRNCKDLALILSAEFNITEAGDYAFSHMFDNCDNLKFASTQEMGIEATKLFKNLIRIGKYAFCGMFMNCIALDKLIALPENLTFTEGACASMYMNCVNLIGRVEYDFSNNGLGPNCFMNMFRNCTEITVAIIKLGNVSDIKRSCCENMFMSCYKITHAMLEVLLVSKEALDKATTTNNVDNSNKYAFCHMFYNCNRLNDFWTNLYIPWSFDLTLEWLAGVAETGTYHYNNILDLEKIIRDTSSVPQGWTLTVGYDVKGESTGE